MSITYNLDLDTSLSKTVLEKLIQEELGAHWIEDSLVTVGLVIDVSEQTEPLTSIIHAAYGFRPAIDVLFTIDSFSGGEEKYTSMLLGAIRLRPRPVKWRMRLLSSRCLTSSSSLS